MEGRESINHGFDEIQKPSQMLESIVGHFNNDRPIKLDTFCKLSASLKQHFKIKVENSNSNINKLVSEEDISNLMSLVYNVIGMNSETVEQDQNSSHHSSLGGKDPEIIILSGKPYLRILNHKWGFS